MTYDLAIYQNDGEALALSSPSHHLIDVDEYFNDLAVAYRAEIKDLYEAGCSKYSFSYDFASRLNYIRC